MLHTPGVFFVRAHTQQFFICHSYIRVCFCNHLQFLLSLRMQEFRLFQKCGFCRSAPYSFRKLYDMDLKFIAVHPPSFVIVVFSSQECCHDCWHIKKEHRVFLRAFVRSFGMRCLSAQILYGIRKMPDWICCVYFEGKYKTMGAPSALP